MTTVGLAGACWGGYWDKFGAELVRSIERMNTQPHSVTIVAEELPGAPEWIQHVRPASPRQKWDWVNQAYEACPSEWAMHLSIDDPMLPHGFDGWNLEGEAISIAGIESGAVWKASPIAYNAILKVRHNPMLGGICCRRDVWLRYPWEPVVCPDWIQWLTFRLRKVDVRFDPAPRYIHRRHPEAHSIQPDPTWGKQLADWRRNHIPPSPQATAASLHQQLRERMRSLKHG